MTDDDNLRANAEASVSRRFPPDDDPVLHELRVHQAELTLQNDELRRVEAELDTSIESYRELFELAPVAYLLLDPSGHVREANAAALKLLGAPPEAVLGRGLLGLFPASSRPAYEAHRRAAAERAHETRALPLLRQDGTLREVQLRSIPAPRSRGSLTALVDVTELRRGEACLKAVLDTVADAVVVAGGEGLVERLNRAAEQMFGLLAREALGVPLAQLACQADRAELAVRVRAARDAPGHPCVPFEFRALRRDGRSFTAELVVVRLQGPTPAIVATIRDLTHHRAVEAARRRAERAGLVTRLAAGVAHDFNNLLQGIEGCVDAALRAGVSDAVREELLSIRAATADGGQIARQLLEFACARNQATEQVPLEVAVREHEGLLRSLLGEGVELHTRLEDQAATVSLSSGDIGRVLVNLCANAKAAMTGGGRVELRTGSVEATAPLEAARLGLPRAGRYRTLEVADTGSGMDEHTRAHALDPFFSGGGADRGAGLGLAMVQGIVARAGGSVQLASTPGEGTVVRVRLPVAGTAAAQGRKLAPVPRGAGQTVFVVDDAEVVRRTLRGELEALGYAVLVASTAHEALRIARERPRVDLLLTDVALPQMDGVQLASELRALWPTLPVAYMSGHPKAMLVREGVLDAEAEVLQKPFSGDELARCVSATLAERH